MDARYVAEQNLLVYAVVGSQSYGMATADSDTDYKGIFFAPKEAVVSPFFTMEQVEGFRDNKDSVVYELKKFIRMLVDQNPNILELLWGEDRFLLQTSRAYSFLRSERHRFLSTKCRFTFSGYAFSQLQRIRGHNKWINNPQPKRRPKEVDFVSVVWNQTTKPELNNQVPFIGYEAYDIGNNIFGLHYTGDSSKMWHDRHEALTAKPATEYNGLTRRPFDLIVKFNKDLYKQSVDTWKNYWEWVEHRNPARSELEIKFGYDTKHAAHLIRLLRMGKEILLEGEVRVFRPDHEELRAIRNGSLKYDELGKMAEALLKEVDEATGRSKLPDTVDIPRAAGIITDIYEECWKSSSMK